MQRTPRLLISQERACVAENGRFMEEAEEDVAKSNFDANLVS